jgi:hypothetical protein
MTHWFWFGILVGADLLPSTGFKINFLLNDLLAGFQNLYDLCFFVIRIFSQL